MHWIDALAEMKKNPGKMFEFPNHKNPEKKWRVRFTEGSIKFIGTANYMWHCADIAKEDQEKDWVEVSQWKKVDYSEFMEWYCNPVNVGKKFKYLSLAGKGDDVATNDMALRPMTIYYSMRDFEIPNE